MEKKFPFWYSAEEKLEVLSFLPDHLRERTDRKLMAPSVAQQLPFSGIRARKYWV